MALNERKFWVALVICGMITTAGCRGEAPPVTLADDSDPPVPIVAAQVQLVDRDGAAIADATVVVGGRTHATDPQGRVRIEGLPKKNVLLLAQAPEFYNRLVVLDGDVGIDQSEISPPPIVLSRRVLGATRFIFAGDVSFGRRFLDPDESTALDQIPPDDFDALIRQSDAESGTRRVLQWVRPFFQNADFGVFNLETPLTRDPHSPHEEKDFAFFSLPDSVNAFPWFGVDYVSLGNNHLYDYLEAGLLDTIAALDGQGIAHSGAGIHQAEALRSYVTTLGNHSYAFFSATSVTGRKHQVSYVADDAKAGAADLTDDVGVLEEIRLQKSAGRAVIAQLHTGAEYTYEPTAYVLGRMGLVAEGGADLIVTHHPHVAQGVGVIDGTVAILGLGNFAFDQDRQETLLGLMAQVTLRGVEVEEVRLIPVYLEDYRPRLIGGGLARSFLRRLGEFSHAYGTLVYPYNNQAWVSFAPGDVRAEDRVVRIEATLPASGESVLDLRGLQQGNESLAEFSFASEPEATISLRAGRDILYFGDFEDHDTDDARFEARRWDMSGVSRSICNDDVYRGSAALCSVRSASNSSLSITPYRNRVRVMGDSSDTPHKDLSLVAAVKGENAGAITIVAKYYASVGAATFGQEDAFKHPGGTFGWTMFHVPLAMPADVPSAGDGNGVLGSVNARALRLSLLQAPPAHGDGMARFDDLAVVSWEKPIEPGTPLQTPHALDFIRLRGPPHHALQVELTFREYHPIPRQD